MQSIGQVLMTSYGDLEEKIAAAARAVERDAAEKRQEFGEDFDINKCWYCGGRGEIPGGRGYCDRCDVGLNLLAAHEYQRRWNQAIPNRFRDYRFATHPNRQASAEVLEWYRDGMPTAQNLYLGGPVGTGKTGIAIAALWAAHQSGTSIKYTTVPDMLDGLRPQSPDRDRNEESMLKLQTVGLLLLDDMGAESSKEWPREQIYMVINGRYHHNLPTIVTSNLTLEKLASPERVGDRTVSRLTENAKAMWLDGEDLRLAKEGI